MRSSKTSKATVVAAVFALSALPLDSALSADPTATFAVDIDPQPLESALLELSKQTHLQLVISTGSLPATMSVPLHGNMPLGVVLDALLKDTGLTYKFVGDHTIAIVKPAGRTSQLSDPPISPGISGDVVYRNESAETPSTAVGIDGGTSSSKTNGGDTSMKHNRLFLRLASLLGFCVSVSATGVVCAQEASTAKAGDVLEEIIVTANRTESLASKTPVALTAVSGDDLKTLGVTNATQLADVTPNLKIDRGNGNGLQITIRGVSSTDNTQKGDPSAAFLLDGIYIPFQNAQEVSLFDLERVEVLRGPQGTLYGRNTTAGVINLISAAPTFNFGGSVDLTVGNYGTKQATGVVNIPLSDTVAVRVAGNYDYRETFVQQAAPQPYSLPADKDNKSARVSLLFKPNDALKLRVTADYSRINGAGSSFGGLVKISNFYQVPIAAPTTSATRMPDPVFLYPSTHNALQRTIVDSAPFSASNYTDGITGQLDWSFSDPWTFTWLGGYRKFSRDETGANYFGTDYTQNPPTDSLPKTFNESVYDAMSHELRIAYSSDKLKAQAGVYYFKYTWDFNLGFDTGGFAFELPAAGESTSKAGFGQATYSLTDQWRVTADARYTKDDKSQTSGFSPFGAPVTNPYIAEASSSKTTWKVGTDYDLTPSTLLYGTIATGYKAGGFNGNCNTTDANCIYVPETVVDYEVGLKAKAFDNTLRVDASAFHYDYTNRQISQIVTDPSTGVPTVNTTNAASAKIDGVELDTSYLPDARDRFDLAVTWLDARYTDYVLQPGNPQSGNFNGAPLDYAPEWTVSAGYSSTLPLQHDDNIVLAIRSHYSSGYKMLSTVVNALFTQPAYTKTDLSLTYNSPKDRWNIQAYVHNIENSVNVTFIDTAVGFPGLNDGKVSVGDPRTFGMHLGVKF